MTILLLLLYVQVDNTSPKANFIHFSPDKHHQNNGHWKVSKQDLNYIKANLKSYIRKQVGENHRILKTWPDYTFQVYGINNQSEGKTIEINGFCINLTLYNSTYSEEQGRIEFTPHMRDVNTTLIRALGGGACYLQISFDQKTQQFTSFMTNEPSTIYPEELEQTSNQ